MTAFPLSISLPVHDPVLIFALVMLIVLTAPVVFRRMRVPGIVGLIVAGAVIGPSGLGVLERDSTMVLLGTVGLLYLMFVAGIGLDMNQFAKLRGRSITFGLLSFLLPQALGLAAGLHVLGFSLHSALLLGSIVGSHTLLAYPIAQHLGLTKNTAVTTIMGGTIITDMLALLVLAGVVRAHQGAEGVLVWATFLAVIAAYFIIVIRGLPRLSRWFLRAAHHDPNLSFIFLITALFVTAYAAQLAYLAPIIGAFLAGILLNRLVPEMGPLMSRVRFVGEALFIPFFLISVGMLVDFSALVQGPRVWLIALLTTGAVVIGKFAAARAAQHMFDHTKDEGMLIFGLTVPQAAATLAVALVGFDIGLFDQVTINAVVVLILITSILGPWIVERAGRRVAAAGRSDDAADTGPPKRIMIPVAHPEHAGALTDLALGMRRDNSAEPVFPLTVVGPEGDVAESVAQAEELLGEAAAHVVAADVPVIPMTRVDASPSEGILRAASERRISHIVIGWGGGDVTRLSRRVFGSVLDRLLGAASQTLVVARLMRPMNTAERIVLVVPEGADGNDAFVEVLADVKTLADRMGASLHALLPRKQKDHFELLIGKVAPDVPLTAEPLDELSGTVAATREVLGEDDTLVLIGSRRHRPGWHPELDRLPKAIVRAFPDQNVVVVYPEETGDRR